MWGLFVLRQAWVAVNSALTEEETHTRTFLNLLNGTKQEVLGGTFRGTQRARWRNTEGE